LQNIQRLGGNASIRSVPGEGATIFLTLPLTLAVMDAMVVKVADSRYVVPLASIVETLSPLPAQIRALPGGARVLTLRNNHISLVSVAEALGLEPTSKPDRLLVMVVELEDGSLAALELDEVLGQQQVVVKNLDGAFGRPASFSSATILGDGKVALILDVSDICRSRRGGGSERMGAAA
jgi:two-component system chemotaxis sensor kinase CheA